MFRLWSAAARRTARFCEPPLNLEALEPRNLLNAGDLDPTFGMGGKVVTDFVGPIAAAAKATVVQPNGKILVAGSGGDTGTFRSLLGRYNTDGSPDASFGTGGRVTSTLFAASNGPTDLTLQQDGKILLVGADPGNPAIQGSSTFAVVRYNPDGSLDATFGNGGVVDTDIGSGISSATGVVVQNDGKIVVAGNAATGNVAVVRYTADGHLDPTFGTAGKAITANVHAGNVALQPDGKIVVAGGTALIRYNMDGSLDGLLGLGLSFSFLAVAVQPDARIVTFGISTQSFPPYTRSFVLNRLNPNGTLDSSFVAALDSDFSSQPGSFIIQADGKIDLVTINTAPSEALTVVRLNSDGSRDMSFGTGGKASADVGVLAGYNAVSIAIGADGKIVAVGTSYRSSLPQFALARFNPDGSLDSSFGTGGKETTGGFVGTVNVKANRVAIQPDGKILVAGSFPASLALARYNTDGTLDPTFGNAGQLIDPDITGGPSALVVQPDSKFLILFGNRLKRYEPDGAVDPTFHADLTSIGQMNLALQPVALQSDGRIIVVGQSKIARLNPDGSLDTTFGNSGVVSVTYFAANIAIQADGKILIVGTQGSGNATQTLLARYNSDGSLDPSFGTAGMVGITPSETTGLAVQPDGKIVIGAPATRFNPDGSPDEFFGLGGRAAGIFTNGRVALTADGKIVLGASFLPPGRGLFYSGVLVLKPNGTVDVRLGDSGILQPDFTSPEFSGSDFALQPDGKIVIAGTALVGGHTSFTVGRYFLSGGSNLTQNQLFVAQIFPDLLRRLVDAAGFAYYSGLLDSGVSRAQVVQQIESSDEYHKLVVSDLYRRILGRFPDNSGNATWTKFLNQGGTAEQVEAFLLGSDEYFQIAGGSNTSFLQTIYPLILHRPIDSSGAQSWGQALATGASRTTVAADILASRESDQLETETLYANFLHRPAEQSGLNTFTNLLQQGVPNETVSAVLIGSEEYFAQI